MDTLRDMEYLNKIWDDAVANGNMEVGRRYDMLIKFIIIKGFLLQDIRVSKAHGWPVVSRWVQRSPAILCNRQPNPTTFYLLSMGINSIIGDIRDTDKLKQVFKEQQPEIVFILPHNPCQAFLQGSGGNVY